ncbi:hypothetical protein OF83DRAFT_1173162 [Amylostereum chailletii]|nr:hypothetical protein OF83DRAFT_1173162 [Amylostereum chailletii]
MSNSVTIAHAPLLPHAHLNADFSRGRYHPAWVKVSLGGAGLNNDMPVAVHVTIPQELENSVSATIEVVGDALSMSTHSGSPPSDVPTLFPSSFEFSMFDPTNDAQWKTLLSILERSLVSGTLRASVLRSHGLELFWMAFIGSYPNFPNGDWASWHPSIALDGAFVCAWFGSGYSMSEGTADQVSNFRRWLWDMFCDYVCDYFV